MIWSQKSRENSHFSRFGDFMERVLGHCDRKHLEIVSVIPVRLGNNAGRSRISSEINYGHTIIGLNNSRSIYDNDVNYQFNPYEEYTHNPLKDTTCYFDFLSGPFELERRNPTVGENFTCATAISRY